MEQVPYFCWLLSIVILGEKENFVAVTAPE
jgi:hypothetical protein